VHGRLVFSSKHNKSDVTILIVGWNKVKGEEALGFAKIIQAAGGFQNDFLYSPFPADLIGKFKDLQ
jgi:hypothetical protein